MTADSYYLQYPAKQKFYVVMAWIGGVFALNTEYWSWFKRPATKLYDLQKAIVRIFIPITIASQLAYLCLNYKEHDFASLATILSIIPVGFVVMMKSFSAQTLAHKKALGRFMDEIHLYNYVKPEFSEQKRNYIEKELIFAEKFSRFTMIYMGTLVFICLVSWNTVPIVHNIQNNPSMHNITVRLEVCIHFWQPFDYEFNFYWYLVIQILGTYCGAVAVVIMVIYDTINFMFIYHLVGHIKIMKYDLKTEFTGKMNEQAQKRKLVDITNYYNFITGTFKEVTAAFGLNVALVYAQNLVQGGLLLYQMMSAGRNLDTILTFGLMIPIFMGILCLISFVLENVRIQADDIPRLLYDLPWESMSISNQKIVLGILFQVQPTLEFIAAFNIKTGVQPAINIIKTTFSYYVMIKSSKEIT